MSASTLLRFSEMDSKLKSEVRMYGCTVDEMREAVEQSLTYRFSGPVMYAMSMMSDAQEMVSYNEPDSMVLEDQRQLLNRAKWILAEYVMENK